ncbi:putative aminotransferase [Actinoplanes missouriensis 431]|uniref:Aminotransferase n=1 Tax=Actinoplanes missouriensis (strain ATCC 14538 / DSM 43046 / CBS 188.64 / JCM 3121 / NBRC 102363 / NCIMB 12654 / NRRL B-3342 / UNCC 431) TaxID=512565 RepID=I0H5Z3_ACTM4|nr:aminotransferase class I/II-fold pyridoxal phosphate-dependent enzyme [Actinoplanes missouriensis]BAL88430.1 putative aminotransferase [Actinoplanes missouriensis 431]
MSTTTTGRADTLDRQFDAMDLSRLRARPGAKWRCTPPDVLPAWVADMDFPVPPPVLAALRAALDTGDLGYPDWPSGATPVREVLSERMAARHGWRPPPHEIREFANVTQAVQVILQTATAPGDPVAIHVPAFRPLLAGLSTMNRPMVPIALSGAGWEFDADRFARDVAATGCRALILVNPHNPTGRVFTRAELAALAAVAERHDLLVISDEVHADLTYAPGEHVPFASLHPDVAARTVTVASASKAFNLAGMRVAACHIGPRRVREALAAAPPELYGAVSLLGVTATVAAWTSCDDWLAGVLAYLDGNRRLVDETLAGVPGIVSYPPQATYLSWLDLTGLGMGPDPAARLLRDGRVLLSSGPDFNPGGDGFARLNFAAPRPVLRRTLERLLDATAQAGRC